MRAVVLNERSSVSLWSDSDPVHSLQLSEILLRQPERLYGEHTYHGGAVWLFPFQREAGTLCIAGAGIHSRKEEHDTLVFSLGYALAESTSVMPMLRSERHRVQRGNRRHSYTYETAKPCAGVQRVAESQCTMNNAIPLKVCRQAYLLNAVQDAIPKSPQKRKVDFSAG